MGPKYSFKVNISYLVYIIDTQLFALSNSDKIGRIRELLKSFSGSMKRSCMNETYIRLYLYRLTYTSESGISTINSIYKDINE